jgi:hypothetical protein
MKIAAGPKAMSVLCLALSTYYYYTAWEQAAAAYGQRIRLQDELHLIRNTAGERKPDIVTTLG